MIELKLPFWLSGEETKKLIIAAQAWWQRVEGWITWPLTQLDPISCTISMLDLLAWQRDITRFEDEPLSLYRLRVKYALINAQEAGSKAGFISIFERLGIGYVEIEERTDPINWDVIRLKISDSQMAGNQTLINKIVQKYGRTCRRYELVIITPITMGVTMFNVDNLYNYNVASL